MGPAGSGKTVLVAEKLSALNENYAVANVPFNFYTTSCKYPSEKNKTDVDDFESRCICSQYRYIFELLRTGC